MTINSGEALERAIGDIGQLYTPGGYCLEHNARWQLAGVTSPFGRQGRIAQIALDAWNWSEYQVPGDANPPDGVPAFFGVSPTRTDRNKAAGDIVTTQRRNGISGCVATDAYGNRVGWMTLEQRAAETQRPYLGWTRDFLGAITTAGVTHALAHFTHSATVQEDTMLALRRNDTGACFALAPGYVRYQGNAREHDLTAKVSSSPARAQNTDVASLKLIFAAYGVPSEAADPNWLKKNANDGAATWSRIGQLQKALGH
ncbi:hypothetical protein [Curtobacterium sp. MCBD17_028]|uniref:hypothetical protein n=1 Tax=Curtobacterium sp. MCBD17_028 TaxID=2175670 RepID=UPI0011B40793|nr:hypothetical protein [Curtobacterium sp. MCBD17_028]